MFTDEQLRAARNALAVQDGVNGRAIAQALVQAYDAWLDACMDTTLTNRCPPVILMIDKLCDLARLKHIENVERFGRCFDQCQEICNWGDLRDARDKMLFQNDEVKAAFERDRHYAEEHGKLDNFEYCERELGRLAGQENRILISHDNLEHSFGFAVVDDNNERAGLNGGMIYHDPEWALHT